MTAERPINADVPATDPRSPAKEPRDDAPRLPIPKPRLPIPKRVKKPGGRRRQHRPIPGALKAIAALVALAIAFLIAAILGGSGSENSGAPSGAAAPLGGAERTTPEEPAAQTSTELGYPAFATANTTRVGGADPASNAAGAALAAFPSTQPGLRPAAITLVDEEDWQAAIAAAVLIAEPVGAPVLISSADGLPEPTADALSALDPQGSDATGGAAAFAIGAVDSGGLANVTTIKSPDPAAAAAAIARLRDRLFKGPPAHIVIAPAQEAAFAMPAAAWAARSGDPVLFAERNALPKSTAEFLRSHSKVPVYVLGPSATISSAVVRKIGTVGNPVRRVSGEDPVANAIALARYDDGDFGWNVNDPGHGFVIARSDSTLAAAAAAPLSASGAWGPLLLTDSADTLPGTLRGYLLDVKPGYTTDPTRAFYNHVWVIGDQEAIDVNQQAEIDNLAKLAKIGDKP
ncbi:MAG TPA: cell wall-binding repeat-containing protein [Solirubrobacterales bacterium]